MSRRYAVYVPGEPVAAPPPAAPPPLDGREPWVLRRLDDGRWMLEDTEYASNEPMGVIDATFWAGELIDAEAGTWVDVDTERGEDESGLYRWRAGTDHIQRCGD